MNSISLFDPDFINKADADKLYAALVKLPWSEQSYFTPRGQFTLPRVFQWMGIPPQPQPKPGQPFKKKGSIYAGEYFTPIEWTPEALEIQQRIFEKTGFRFDSVNINGYRNGKDHIGWHRDDEKEGLWTFPIASVSLGARRTFETTEYGSKGELPHGSLVVMPADSQAIFKHRLRAATKQQAQDSRVNLTFRMMTKAACS